MFQAWMTAVFVLSGATAFASGSAGDAERILEARLRAAAATDTKQSVSELIPNTLELQASSLKALAETQVPPTAPSAPKCTETRQIALAGRYAIGYDTTLSKPCRIYDLSFPTLFGTATKKTVSSVPVEKLTAADYLAWIDGRYDDVYARMETMKMNFNEARVVPASWVKDLKFKATADGAMAMKTLAAGGLPKRFKASDLEVGNFGFTPSQRARLQGVLAQAKILLGDDVKSTAAIEEFWSVLANQPGTFLDQIHFDWNDARKVYDVVLDGQFLPFRGPVALIDYERPYKQAVEAMVRGIIASVMNDAINFIPAPVVKNLVRIAVNDSFEFIDLMYADRQAMLERSLRAALNHDIGAPLAEEQLDRGLDILFGVRADLVTSYLTAIAQGRTVRWDQVDQLGRLARYSTEKQRDIQIGVSNSNLTIKKSCDMTRPWLGFGVCSKAGKKVAVHTLMSEQTVLFWNLGSPVIYDYAHPSMTMMKRATSWLLSAAVRTYYLPYVGFLQNTLASQLKGFAKAGLVDEAYLKGELSLVKKRDGQIGPEQDQILTWLYLQNINPFLPHSPAADEKMIVQTGAKLGLTESALGASLKP